MIILLSLNDSTNKSLASLHRHYWAISSRGYILNFAGSPSPPSPGGGIGEAARGETPGQTTSLLASSVFALPVSSGSADLTFFITSLCQTLIRGGIGPLLRQGVVLPMWWEMGSQSQVLAMTLSSYCRWWRWMSHFHPFVSGPFGCAPNQPQRIVRDARARDLSYLQHYCPPLGRHSRRWW